MSDFQLNNTIADKKIFLVNYTKLENRYDAQFYGADFNFDNCIKLSKIAKVSGGKRLPKGLDYSKERTNYRYLRVGNIDWEGNLAYDKFKYLSKELYEILKNYQIFKGDLMLAIVGATIGKCSILNPPYDDEIILTENCAKIRLKTDTVLPDFFYLLLQSEFIQKQIQLNYIQTTLPKIGLDRVLGLKIPKPPKIGKQKDILEFYKKRFQTKQQKEAEAKQLLASIDDYLLKELGIILPEKDSSLKNRIFTTNLSKVSGGRFDPFYNDVKYLKIEEQINNCNYKTKQLRKLCYSVSGVIYSGKDERNEGKAILRGNNITLETNELNFNKIRYIDENINVSDNLLLQKNDIFMSSASGSKEHVGKVAFIDNDLNYYFGGFMMVLRQIENNYNQKYLFEFLQSTIFRKYLFKNLGGTNINNLNFNMISKLNIPLPKIDKQTEIANYISGIRNKAKLLENEAKGILEKAKQVVEQMILGKK